MTTTEYTYKLARDYGRDMAQEARSGPKALAAFTISPPFPSRAISLFLAHWGRNDISNAKDPTYCALPEFGESSNGEWRPRVSISSPSQLTVDVAPCIDVSYREGSCIDHFKPRIERCLKETMVELDRRDEEYERNEARRNAVAAALLKKLAAL